MVEIISLRLLADWPNRESMLFFAVEYFYKHASILPSPRRPVSCFDARGMLLNLSTIIMERASVRYYENIFCDLDFNELINIGTDIFGNFN